MAKKKWAWYTIFLILASAIRDLFRIVVGYGSPPKAADPLDKRPDKFL